MSRRRLAAVFALTALLQLIPIWSVRYLPTNDGPSHVYNAWILRELVMGHGGIIGQTFRVDWRPQPNWIGTAAMALLMAVFPPLAAEKLFVTSIVLLFALAAWMYAGALDERSRIFAFLALPLTFHWLLQAGFYNFSLGVALAFITIALWIRRRLALVALLLVAGYFSHPMTCLFALGAMGLVWLMTRPRRLADLMAFVPVLPLLIWYVAQQKTTGVTSDDVALLHRIHELATVRISWAFSAAQRVFGIATLIAIVVLAVGTFVRRGSNARALMIVTLILFVAYFAAPATAAGGLFLRERTMLLLLLSPLAWLSGELDERVRIGIVGAFTALTLAHVVYLTSWYWTTSRTVERFVRGIDGAKPESTILAIVDLNYPAGATVDVIAHSVDYAAIEHRLTDVNDYEADSGLFPIAFRGAKPIVNPAVDDPADWSRRVDYLFAYHLSTEDSRARRTREFYRPIRVAGDGWLNQRMPSSSDAGDDLILLPVAGTIGDFPAPLGMRFRVDQTMRNGGATPVRVRASQCALTPECEFDLLPARSVALAGENGRPPFITVEAPRAQIGQLEVSTVVRRTDDPAAWEPVSVPAIRESQFSAGDVTLPNVPTDAPMNLRVWFFGQPVPAQFRVRAFAANGEPRGEKTYPFWPFGYATFASIDHDFPALDGEPATFVITPLDVIAKDARTWAFMTTTDMKSGKTTLTLPR